MTNITVQMPINHSITVLSDGKFITATVFDMDIPDNPDGICHAAAKQLDEYFDGRRKAFDLPYSIDNLGTPFFRSILHAIEKIPYGSTVTYKDVAASVNSAAVRATGSALKKNPLPIIIPCHRIVPASGGYGNYMGGTGNDIKRFLLALEKGNG